MSSSWDWPGSRWWRVDFHSHSPASYDFGREEDRLSPDWIRWIEAAKNSGLDAIAVTDHNTSAGLSDLAAAARCVENAPTVFPGVELTASDGVHLLLLMDPSCTHQHIDDLLSRMDVPVEKRSCATARSKLSIEKILDECGEDAIVIAAHVNGESGLLQKLEGQQRIAVLNHRNLTAVEIDPDKEIDESWIDGSKKEVGRQLSQVWSSDAHSYVTLGERFTWVKMTRPDLEGLRLALMDGASSLIPSDQASAIDPNSHADLALEHIAVRDAKYIGRPSQTGIAINPWLNAIIGGRGTGKSTLIDLCRKTLRREGELEGSDRGEEGSLRAVFDRRMRVPASHGQEGLLTDETYVEIVYRKDGQRYLLSWSHAGKALPIVRLDGDSRIPEEGDIGERFPARIYSQKQLFALAQDPNALLSVIDNSQEVRGTEQTRVIEQLRNQYLSLCTQARAASTEAKELPGRRASLEDVQRKLDVLEGGGQAQILNEYRKRRQQDETWRAIFKAAFQTVESVAESAGELSVADLNLEADFGDDPAQKSLNRAHEALRQSVKDLGQAVSKSVDQARLELNEINNGEDANHWRAAVAASERKFEGVMEQLEKEGISDPNEYTDLLESAARIGREIETLEKKQVQARELEQKATETLAEYRTRRRALSLRRKDFAEGTSGENIRIEIDEYANHGNLAGDLGEILGIERFDADRQYLAERIQPKLDQAWEWHELDGVVAEMRRLLSGDLDAWSTKDHRFETAVRRLPPERIDRLALYLPEDSVRVAFRDRSRRDWTPLTQGSPGQQTAALLAFVLGYGYEPIVLDQPEDDLDNTLIYELLVNRLRETKTKRQVIVVTHNANIVVHGDAELVLTLEARCGQSHIASVGGLQERSVRDEICRVMEGGKEAFETRYRRIIPGGG